MITRKQINVSPEVHDRLVRAAKQLKVTYPKALVERIIIQALKDKDFMASVKEYFAK